MVLASDMSIAHMVAGCLERGSEGQGRDCERECCLIEVKQGKTT